MLWKIHGFHHEKVQKCLGFSHNEKNNCSKWARSVNCLCLKSLLWNSDLALIFENLLKFEDLHSLVSWCIPLFPLCLKRRPWKDVLKSQSWEAGNVDKVILCRQVFLQRDYCGMVAWYDLKLYTSKSLHAILIFISKRTLTSSKISNKYLHISSALSWFSYLLSGDPDNLNLLQNRKTDKFFGAKIQIRTHFSERKFRSLQTIF